MLGTERDAVLDQLAKEAANCPAKTLAESSRLINEKYVGNNVWNRASFKLKKKRVRNSPAMWIRADGAFEPVVDRDLFEAAQAIIRERSRRLSNEEMLDMLQHLFQARGYLP